MPAALTSARHQSSRHERMLCRKEIEATYLIKLNSLYSPGKEVKKLEQKYLGSSTRRYPSKCSMSIPPRHCRTDPSGIVTLADRWFWVLSSFCGTASTSSCISARALHMCHDVLVVVDDGLLEAWIKWISSSTRSTNFFFLAGSD